MTVKRFTLIELLVVIGIISVLATIFFPVISSMRSKGESTSCKNMMRQYAFASLTYASIRNGFLPDIQTYLQPETGFVKMFGSKVFAEDITRCPVIKVPKNWADSATAGRVIFP